MGASVSVAQEVKDNLILNKGATFLYSVPDPVSYFNRYYGNSSDSCSIFTDVICKKRRHLIYEGEVVAPYRGSDGKIVYAYRLKKFTASTDQHNPSAPDSKSWTLEGSGFTDERKLYYFGYTGAESEIGIPPPFLTLPAKQGYPANYDGKHSLIPGYIPSDDPNLGIDGEFGRMSKQQIYKVLNSHAINTSYFAEIDRPEVVERSKEFSSLSVPDIYRTFMQNATRIGPDIDTTSKYTLQYTKKSNGVPMTETLDIGSFYSKGPTVFVKRNFPDMRSIVNKIQTFVVQGVKKIEPADIKRLNYSFRDVFELTCKPGDPQENYKFLMTNYSSKVDDVLYSLGNELPDYIREHHPAKVVKIPQILIKIAHYQSQRLQVIDPAITMLAAVFECQMILNS